MLRRGQAVNLVDNLVFDSLRHSKTNLGKDLFNVKAGELVPAGAPHAALACLRQVACGGFESSSGRGFSHDAVSPNTIIAADHGFGSVLIQRSR